MIPERGWSDVQARTQELAVKGPPLVPRASVAHAGPLSLRGTGDSEAGHEAPADLDEDGVAVGGLVPFVPVAEPVADISTDMLGEIVSEGGGEVVPVDVVLVVVVEIYPARGSEIEAEAAVVAQVALEADACAGYPDLVAARTAREVLEYPGRDGRAGKRIEQGEVAGDTFVGHGHRTQVGIEREDRKRGVEGESVGLWGDGR